MIVSNPLFVIRVGWPAFWTKTRRRSRSATKHDTSKKFFSKKKNFFFNLNKKTCWIRRCCKELSSSIGWRVMALQSLVKKVAAVGLKGF